MRALITGGAGFIGSAVVRHGLQRGWQITILDNLSTGYLENIPFCNNVDFIKGDIRDEATVKRSLRGVDVVFHLAAHVGNIRSLESPLLDSDVNVLGTLRILEGMRHAGVRRIVYSSSAAIYGEPSSMPISEDHRCEPDAPYGVSKLAAEKLALCYGKVYDMQVVALRYFNVYGVNQRYDAYGNVIPIFADHLMKGTDLVIYGDGEQTRDFVNVEDIAGANWLAVENNLSGAFNVASGKPTTINSLAMLMRSIHGGGSDIRYANSRPGEVRHSLADLKRASAMMGFRAQIPLDSGLTSYLEWVDRFNHLKAEANQIK